MFVGGVLVIKLVLHQAGELAEFGQVLAQQIDLVHGAQDGRDVAALAQNLAKRFVDVRVLEKKSIHQ